MKLNEVVAKFSGAAGEDIEQWLDRFSVAIRVTEEITPDPTTDPKGDKAVQKKMVTLMPLLLNGSAYATWKRLSTADKEDHAAIVKALRRVYGKTKAAAWRELKALRLLPGEPVDVLADQITNLLSVVTGGKDCPGPLAAAFLLDAIPSRIAQQARLRHGEDMDLDAIVSSVKTLLAGSEENTETAAVSISNVHTGTATGNRVSSQDERGEKTKTLRCYGCNRLGHARRDCPVVCFRCHGRGHIQRNCLQAQLLAGNDQARAAAADRATPAEDL